MLLFAAACSFGTGAVRGGGLDAAEAIGPFLDGILPSRAPTAASGSWELVNAFPNLVFVDPIQMLPVPESEFLLMAEKWGALMVFPNDPETDERNVVLDLSAQTQVEGDSGLLGLAFHPEFGQEGSPNREFLYVYYRFSPDPSELDRAYCRLSRFSWQGGLASIDLASEEVLINQYDRHNWHNGGGLFFGNDGFLYLAIGDEGGSNDAFGSSQRLDGGLFAGVLRIDVDRDPARSHPIRRQPIDQEPPPPGWPASFTQGYFIPDDNPWLSPDGSGLEEFWAVGTRSPYRMSLDPPTGSIWLGDVGQSAEEEINLVVRGANYQWPFREGNREGAVPRPAQIVGEERAPLHRYGRGEGGCVIGGYVYRGTQHPELVGKYLFGDFNNGLVRTLDHSPGEPPVVEEIAELGDRQLTSFGIDAEGELYLLTIGQTFLNGGIVYKLRREGTARPQPPATLSATDAFTDLASLNPRSGVMPYDLAQALWSDGSEKKRWIAIPNDGTPDSEAEQIRFSENGPWDFPAGTVLIKHFEFGGRRLETRFLVKGEDEKFFGFTYRWRPDHSDADLLPGPAVEETIPLPGGGSLLWHFPGRVECFECHTEASGTVLGPKTRHLHRDLFYPKTGRTANQLETWIALGFFSNPPDSTELPNLLASANLNDETESLDRRARSYLDVNCSHCHLPGGPTQAQFDLRLTTPPNYQNLVNVDPDNALGFTDPKLVKPGAPELSVLLFRLGTLDTCCAMPPIAKNAVDEDAVRVLTAWIASLDPATSPSGRNDNPVPLDLSLPQLSLSLPEGPTVTGRFEVSVSASEPVFGLSLSDFVVTNGRVLSLVGSGESYALAIQPRLGGAGTVTLPADRVVDANGNANRRLDGPLLFDFQQSASANLLDNGGFESGLEGWRAGGGAGESPLGLSGGKGVRLSADASLVQSFELAEARNYVLSGWARKAGGDGVVEIAVAFWDAEGRWLRERVVVPPLKSDFDSFRVAVTAPANAVSATVAVLASGAGATILDSLAFSADGAGEPPGGPLTDNGDFERGLLFWETENEVTVSALANLGQGAARIGANSSATFRRSILPETRIVMTGAYFTEGDPPLAEAGLSFWSEAGDFLGEEKILLHPSAGYHNFFFFAHVPEAVDHLTMWVRNGADGAVTIDDLGLVYVPESPRPEPRDPDTGFENGLDPWRSGGSVDLDGPALAGTRAARLSPASFLETSRATSAGTSYRFGGHYRTVGVWGLHEAGLVFRDRDGEVVGESTLVLRPSSAYAPFELSAVAPAGAVSVSLWIYNGETGTLALDELAFMPTAETVPVAAGANAALLVRIGGNLSREKLSARDPRLFSSPLGNRVQPDLAIRGNRSGFVGRGVYDASGNRQIGLARSGRGLARVAYRINWQNAATLRRDAATLAGKRGNRVYRLSFFETRPAQRNLTGLVVSGRYRTPEADPGGSAAYEARLRQSRWVRRIRFDATLTARSVFSPGVRDTVRMRLR